MARKWKEVGCVGMGCKAVIRLKGSILCLPLIREYKQKLNVT